MKTYLALMSAAARSSTRTTAASRVADNPADPYMTMLGYFNSLRELGGTRRLVEDEVNSRLNQYGKRKRIGETESPFADRDDRLRGPGADLARTAHHKVAEAKRRLEPRRSASRTAWTSPSPRT